MQIDLEEQRRLDAFYIDAENQIYSNVGPVTLTFIFFVLATHVAELGVIIADSSAYSECCQVVWYAVLVDFILGQTFGALFMRYAGTRITIKLSISIGSTLSFLVARFIPTVMVSGFFIWSSESCRDNELIRVHNSLFNVAMMMMSSYLAAFAVFIITYRNLIFDAFTALQRRYESVMAQHHVFIEEYRDNYGHIAKRHRVRRGEQIREVIVQA